MSEQKKVAKKNVSKKSGSVRKILINATEKEEIRVAFVEDGRLTDLDIDSNIHISKKSNIYKGVISRVEPSLNAVFVDYGADKHGFLPFKEIDKSYFSEPLTKDNKDDIKSLVKEGQFLIVQIVKEERGTKGAAISTFIRLPGCYLVLMPNNDKSAGISRKIEGENRQDIKDILNKLQVPEGMGLIVRTAGLGRKIEDLSWDLSILCTLWESIKTVADQSEKPFLIFQESDVIFRAVRDYLQHDLNEIVVDTQEAYDQVIKHVAQLRPDFSERVSLYKGMQTLYSKYRLEFQIELAYRREVDLLSGGSIVIDQGEALIAIDVNSKKATSGANVEETAFNTNLEAAEEISRQLKIRDLGGLLVIDFIDMMSVKNQKKLEQYFTELLKKDRARTQMARISRFGLLEMSRQRVRPALAETLQHVCPQCQGNGRIRSTEIFSLSMLRLLQEQLVKNKMVEIQFILPVEVATYLLNEKRSEVSKLEEFYNLRILIIPNPDFAIPNYEFRRKRQSVTADSSYKIQQGLHNKYSYNIDTNIQQEVPMVTHSSIVKAQPYSVTADTTEKKSGIFKRIWGDWLGLSSQDGVVSTRDNNDVSGPVTVLTSAPDRPKYEPGSNPVSSSHRSKQQNNRKAKQIDKKDTTGLEQKSLRKEEDKSKIKTTTTNKLKSEDRGSISGIEPCINKDADNKIILPKARISKNVKDILKKYSSGSNNLSLVQTSSNFSDKTYDIKIKHQVNTSELKHKFDINKVKERFARLDKVKLLLITTSAEVLDLPKVINKITRTV